jgi:biopolymer transport protein ExbD
MIRIPRPQTQRQREGTIALINIVFLMLIFFLIAGTLAPPVDPEVRLITTVEAEQADPPRALFVTASGELRAGGAEVTVEGYVAALRDDNGPLTVKLAADRDLPAERLIDVIAELRGAGVELVSVVTERATR